MDWVVVESVELDDLARAALRELWDTAFAGGFSDEDADHSYGGVHAVGYDGQLIVAHASAVPRRIRAGQTWSVVGYVEAVATTPARQGQGLGRAAMELLQDELEARWTLGVLSTGAPGFYERLGWERWRGPSFVLAESGLVRTEDEDDGLMVLRFGPTASLPLNESITCEDRAGDAW